MPDLALLANDKGVDLEVCQCSGCGLVQLSNQPVPYYKDVIRSAAFSEEMKSFRMEQFSHFVNKYFLQDKKVLEVGCGKGEYLSLMQECGVDAYGVEHAEESVTECLNVCLKVTQGFVDSAESTLPDAPFDAFFILNFLEHIPDLNSVLRGIHNNLCNHAVGLIEVPNFDMILKKKLFSEFVGDHLHYFTEATLTKTLDWNGFEILECKPVWYDYILSAVVKKREPIDLSSFAEFKSKLTQEILVYISQYGEKRVAVWGAGHQALAVLALADLAGKIKYVIDSAPFKQGKLTPATHIPIVSPDMLDSDPVEAIIIMAASYSDEVEKIINQKFSANMAIAVLRDSRLQILRGKQGRGDQ